VTSIPLCTSCRPDLLFSYRRAGRRSGRMLNFVTAAEKGSSAALPYARQPAVY
jgi:hypothetical protein